MKKTRFGLVVLLLAGLAAASGCTAAETNAPQPFYFVQITDTHFGSCDHEERTQRVVDMINRLPMKIAFVAHTGDIASDNLDKPQVLNTASSVLARLNVPIRFVAGNHDILAKRVAPTLNAYTNTFGPLASRAEFGGVIFLFLYTEPLRREVSIPGYDPLAWLETELKAAGRQPVIICHHAPSVEDFYNNSLHPGWKPEVHERWVRLLRSANVRAVLTGHYHRDELHWEGGVPLFVGSSVASYWGRQGSFRIYEYRDGRLGYRTVYLEEPSPNDGEE